MLIQQGMEKYLKGFLVLHRQRPRRTHDLSLLLGLAVAFRPDLEEYEDVCVAATAYYLEDRYPPGPSVARQSDEMVAALVKAEKLAAKLKGEVL